jgi:hypothetical protein
MRVCPSSLVVKRQFRKLKIASSILVLGLHFSLFFF